MVTQENTHGHPQKIYQGGRAVLSGGKREKKLIREIYCLYSFIFFNFIIQGGGALAPI